jgi:hypothetical protein
VAVGDQADDGTGGDGRAAALEAALADRDAKLADVTEQRRRGTNAQLA